jgi:uncharacterized protein YciI
MQFIVTGYDGDDDNAPQRRMDARSAHITNLEKLYKQGSILYAAAITDDAGKMIGSMVVAEYDSEAALKEKWLDNEAYVVQDVWKKIEIKSARVAGFCKK